MKTPMEKRLDKATKKAIAKAKKNGTYKPPVPAYDVQEQIGRTPKSAWRVRRINYQGGF